MKRSLFVTSNRLGDAVLTTGVLHHLIRREPEIPVTVVCGSLPMGIFQSVNGVDRVVPVVKRRFSLHWPMAVRDLGFQSWHRIVDFRASLLGFLPTRHRHIWKGGDEHIHKAVANARLIGVDHPLPPYIELTPSQELWAVRTFNLQDDPRPILALAPTANHFHKQWPHTHFLSLARHLTGPNGLLEGARIAVFGAPGEEAQAAPVVTGLPADQVIDMVGKTRPEEAACLISKSALFVGNDSGLMHSAVAVDTPTVGLFGIGQPAVYGPFGPRSLCLTSSPAGASIHMTASDGTDPLPVDYVLQEITRFLASLPDPAPRSGRGEDR